MNNDWKPTEQNMEHFYSKWYDLDTTKITSIKDIQVLFSAIELKIAETIEEFDKVKHLLIIPEESKTLDEITQEFDEKIDELLVKTKKKFAVSKQNAEYHYNAKFSSIFDNFEYAVKNGNFPPKLTLTYNDNGLSACSFETSYVIRQGNKQAGYYTFGNGLYFKYYMPTKPNVIARFFMKQLLGFRWIDETT